MAYASLSTLVACLLLGHAAGAQTVPTQTHPSAIINRDSSTARHSTDRQGRGMESFNRWLDSVAQLPQNPEPNKPKPGRSQRKSMGKRP